MVFDLMVCLRLDEKRGTIYFDFVPPFSVSIFGF